MSGPDEEGAGPEPRPAGEPTALPPEPAKLSAEKLVLRAAPRRVVRFRSGVIIGGAACASLAIAGVAWMALGPKTLQVVATADEKAVADRRPPADAVANLPGAYGELPSGVPVLGDPLPGDLGRPILEHQRGLGIDPATDPNAMPPSMTMEEQSAGAERQRIASQAAQAREAGVMVQSSGRGAAAPVTGGIARPQAVQRQARAIRQRASRSIRSGIRTTSSASSTLSGARRRPASPMPMRCRSRHRPTS